MTIAMMAGSVDPDPEDPLAARPSGVSPPTFTSVFFPPRFPFRVRVASPVHTSRNPLGTPPLLPIRHLHPSTVLSLSHRCTTFRILRDQIYRFHPLWRFSAPFQDWLFTGTSSWPGWWRWMAHCGLTSALQEKHPPPRDKALVGRRRSLGLASGGHGLRAPIVPDLAGGARGGGGVSLRIFATGLPPIAFSFYLQFSASTVMWQYPQNHNIRSVIWGWCKENIGVVDFETF